MKSIKFKIISGSIIGVVVLSTIFVLLTLPMVQTSPTVNEEKDSLQSPIVAASWNTRLILTGINQTHTLRGKNFTLSGVTQKFVTGNYVNTSNMPVFPILNSVNYDGNGNPLNLTIRSGVGGIFSISIQVNDSYSNLDALGVKANITNTPTESIYVTSKTTENTTVYSHDVTTTTNMSLLTNLDALGPLLPGDVFTVGFNLTDSQGTPIANLNENLSVYINNNKSNIVAPAGISTNGDGSGLNIQITQEENMTHAGINFIGKGNKTGTDGFPYFEYEGCSIGTAIKRAENITADLIIDSDIANKSLTSNIQILAGGSIDLRCTLYFNGDTTLPLKSREVNLFVNDTLDRSYTTDSEGKFTANVSLTAMGFNSTDTNSSITLAISLKNFDTAFDKLGARFNQSLVFEAIVEPEGAGDEDAEPVPEVPDDAPIADDVPTNWAGIIVPIAVIAAVVIGIVMFQRKKMDLINKQTFSMRTVDKGGKFAIITMLYEIGRRREALAYTYKIYSDLINEKYSLAREMAQTLREFAVVCVTKYGQDPLKVYPYVSIVENVIYGAIEVDAAIFDRAMTLFGRVFQEITGTIFSLKHDSTTNIDIHMDIAPPVGAPKP
jgi:hypothetical protein